MTGLVVTCAPNVPATPDEVRASPVFQQWLDRMNTDGRGIDLRSVEILAVHAWGNPREIKMIHLLADAYEGVIKLPGVSNLRGATVDVLTLLDDGEDLYVVFVEQARVPGAQSRVVSNPSGMVDAGETMHLAGLRELYEELPEGTTIEWGEPIDLGHHATGSSDPLLGSPGGSDEVVQFLVVRANVTTTQVHALRDKFGGNVTEGERTRILVRPYREARAALVPEGGGKVCIKTLLSLLLHKEYAGE